MINIRCNIFICMSLCIFVYMVYGIAELINIFVVIFYNWGSFSFPLEFLLNFFLFSVTKIECHYFGKVYVIGQRFIAIDKCNQCTCKSTGTVICTETICSLSKTTGNKRKILSKQLFTDY